MRLILTHDMLSPHGAKAVECALSERFSVFNPKSHGKKTIQAILASGQVDTPVSVSAIEVPGVEPEGVEQVANVLALQGFVVISDGPNGKEYTLTESGVDLKSLHVKEA